MKKWALWLVLITFFLIHHYLCDLFLIE
jgi:hypothetical protein